MAVLFISHSTADDNQASALASWLKENGFTDVFFDHGSIAGGDKWRDELRASANSCRVRAWIAHAGHADSWRLRRALFKGGWFDPARALKPGDDGA